MLLMHKCQWSWNRKDDLASGVAGATGLEAYNAYYDVDVDANVADADYCVVLLVLMLIMMPMLILQVLIECWGQCSWC